MRASAALDRPSRSAARSTALVRTWPGAGSERVAERGARAIKRKNIALFLQMQRRAPAPAPAARGARKAARIGKAEEVGDLRSRQGRVRAVLRGKPPAPSVEQLAERGAFVAQLALEAAQGEGTR